ncbi:hypothetical protein AO391_08395 [Pseudomonas marginalis ICMP 9505]|nr:hypothetical protein AO391_08395 [Pseudomonas marginalis ICMP 9505]
MCIIGIGIEAGNASNKQIWATSYTPFGSVGLSLQNCRAYSHAVAHKAIGFGDSTTIDRNVYACLRDASARNKLLNGSCARETFGSAGFPIVPVRQPAYSCHLLFGDKGVVAILRQPELHI